MIKDFINCLKECILSIGETVNLFIYEEDYQMGQNQSNGYVNNSFRPTPSGERIRQAAASNFF